jgi:predicted HicB family RNase H-like nuclease
MPLRMGRSEMPRGTTLRNVRVADALWDAAKVEAERQERTLSDVIREALERFVAGAK